MKESYYSDPVKKHGTPSSVIEWVPIIDGVLHTPKDITEEIMALIERSPYEKNAKRLYLALLSILEIGKRDMSNPKYDDYFQEARDAIAEVDITDSTEENIDE